jgi:YHS domain-containing protein
MNRTAVVLLAVLALVPACSKRGDSAGRAPSATEATGARTSDSASGVPAATGSPDEIVVDPFCGMKLKKSEAAASATYDGVTYWFCLADHRDAFLADPQRALCRTGLGDAGADCGRD